MGSERWEETSPHCTQRVTRKPVGAALYGFWNSPAPANRVEKGDRRYVPLSPFLSLHAENAVTVSYLFGNL